MAPRSWAGPNRVSACAACPARQRADTSIPWPAVIPRSGVSLSCPPSGQGKLGRDRNHRAGSLLTLPQALGWVGCWARPLPPSSSWEMAHHSGGLGPSPKLDSICSLVCAHRLPLAGHICDGCGIGWYLQFTTRGTPLRKQDQLLPHFCPSSLEVISNCFCSDTGEVVFVGSTLPWWGS